MLSSARIQERLARRTIALVLAGGRGSRLKQLTDRRAKPAVFFGGKFRIIDFVLSNCLNSNIRRIAVLTQYKAHSLLRHLQMGWSFLRPEMNEFLDLLPAQQRLDEATWYRGTADAVFQNFDILKAARPEFFVVLAGDHIYKMDYSNMLNDMRAKGADCIVGCVEVPIEQASEFGVMACRRVEPHRQFPRKAALAAVDPRQARPMRWRAWAFTRSPPISSMPSCSATTRPPDSSRDFGKDVIPSLVSRGLAVAHRFEDSCVTTTPEAEPYWRDVGTIDAYWAANLDLVMPTPQLDIYDRNWPVWTYQQQLPPAKFVFDDEDRRGIAVDSMVSGGCIVSGARVARSLLFSSVRDQLLCADLRGGAVAGSRGRPLCAAQQGRRRSRLPHPGRAGRRRGSRRRCAALLSQRGRRRPDQRRHARRAVTVVRRSARRRFGLNRLPPLGQVSRACSTEAASFMRHRTRIALLLAGLLPGCYWEPPTGEIMVNTTPPGASCVISQLGKPLGIAEPTPAIAIATLGRCAKSMSSAAAPDLPRPPSRSRRRRRPRSCPVIYPNRHPEIDYNTRVDITMTPAPLADSRSIRSALRGGRALLYAAAGSSRAQSAVPARDSGCVPRPSVTSETIPGPLSPARAAAR